MPQSVLILLRIVHVVSGAIWVGALVIAAFFVMPSVTAAGPAGGQVMKGLLERKYPQLMMALMGLTILSGGTLMWWVSKNFGGNWMATGMGRTIGFGAAIAIIATGFGMAIARPTATRMQKLMGEIAGGAPSATQAAEMQMLQNKMLKSTRIVAVLLMLAAAAMASARYM